MYINKIIKLSPICFVVIFFSILFPSNVFLNTNDDYEEKLCKEKLASFNANLKDENISDIISVVGKSFLGTPYVAGTLDKNINTEKLVLCMSGLDCVTFVENTLAISRLIQKGKMDLNSFKDELQFIRYRDGNLDGYASRLHYFCEWITNNEDKGIVRNITKKIGGVPYHKKINFMSTHVKSYKQLADNDENLEQIKKMEAEVDKIKMFYIPKEEVDAYYDDMQTGDIIATTTEIKGLDVTHTGYIYKENGKTYFLHASSIAKEVIISKDELKIYLASDVKKTGIMIVRPISIKN